MMLKNKVQKYFRNQGLNLEPKATSYVVDSLEKLEVEKHVMVLEKMVNELSEQNLSSDLISLDIIRNTVKYLTSNSNIALFQVIDAFKVPNLKYNGDVKRFYIPEKSANNRFSTLISDRHDDKSNILKDRYSFIVERLIRNEILDFYTTEEDRGDGLKTVEYLLSGGTRGAKVKVLGMLSQQQEAVWCLEDVSGIVKINIDETEYHKGLVLEGSFVLAEGQFCDRIFKVSAMGLPPLESSQASREAVLTRTNYFGGFPENGTLKTCPHMTKISNKNMSGKALVFISEIWLDREIIFSKLETLFSGYSSLKPGAFIFSGNFLSPDMNIVSESTKLKILKKAMKRIVLLFATFRDLALNSHLVFIPGPNDPYQSNKNILPRASLPEKILLESVFSGVIPNLKENEKLELKKRVIMASNPCRLTYYNKEIVVFRDNLGQKMYRHCMYIPSQDLDKQTEEAQINDNSINMSVDNTVLNDSEMEQREPQNVANQTNFLEYQLAWTLLSQAHLLPLPLHVSPVYWGHDQALRLFPTPDLVVISDPTLISFDMKVNDSVFVNPPNFSSGDSFNFKIYYPYNDEIESCSLDI